MVNKILNYIDTCEKRCYKDGIPDEAPLELESRSLVPSYRCIAKAILKNDPSLKSLGFTPTKSKYYHDLKKKELEKTDPNQLKLF